MSDTFSKLIEARKNTTWLQNVGAAFGKPAKNIRVGDVLGWNWGGTSQVVKIEKETDKFVWILEEYESYDGEIKTAERKLGKDRIVAIVENGKFKVSSMTKSDYDLASRLSKRVLL